MTTSEGRLLQRTAGRRFRRGRRAVRAFEPGSPTPGAEPNDPNAMALATVDAEGLPNVRMVLLKGVDGPTRRARVRLLHQLRERQGPGAAGRQGGALFPLEVAAPAGARARPRLGGERRGGRRLFRHPPARHPPRRLGLATVAAAGEPLRAREGGGRGTARYPIGEVPGRPTGRASGSCRSRSSSGTTGPSACTSGWPSAATTPRRPGGHGSILEAGCSAEAADASRGAVVSCKLAGRST